MNFNWLLSDNSSVARYGFNNYNQKKMKISEDIFVWVIKIAIFFVVVFLEVEKLKGIFQEKDYGDGE